MPMTNTDYAIDSPTTASSPARHAKDFVDAMLRTRDKSMVERLLDTSFKAHLQLNGGGLVFEDPDIVRDEFIKGLTTFHFNNIEAIEDVDDTYESLADGVVKCHVVSEQLRKGFGKLEEQGRGWYKLDAVLVIRCGGADGMIVDCRQEYSKQWLRAAEKAG